MARFKDITGPKQYTSKNKIENALLQHLKETDELKDLDKPLVVIKDEHGSKSMYWCLETMSEDNLSKVWTF